MVGLRWAFCCMRIYLAGEGWAWLQARLISGKTAGEDQAPRPETILGSPFRLKRLLFIGVLIVGAVCINPSGPVMLLYPFKTVSIGALQDYIQEWQSPDFHLLSVQPFIWLLLLTLGAAGASRRRLALTDFLLVAGFAYLGLMAGRNVALFALAAPPVLARHATPLLESWSHGARVPPGSSSPDGTSAGGLEPVSVWPPGSRRSCQSPLWSFPRASTRRLTRRIFLSGAVEF